MKNELKTTKFPSACLCFLFVFFSSLSVFVQGNRTIGRTVSDIHNEPVVGASVSMKRNTSEGCYLSENNGFGGFVRSPQFSWLVYCCI